jgi:hypothetical protein
MAAIFYGARCRAASESRWQGFRPFAYLATLTIAVSPWAIRNAVSLGTPLATTTHGGYTFYLANNRDFFAYLRGPQSIAWDASAFNERWRTERAEALGPGPWPHGTERAADRLAYARGQAAIAADPAGAARAAGHRLRRFWGLMPEQLTQNESSAQRFARWIVGGWYAVVLALAAIGLCLSFSSASGKTLQQVDLLRLSPALLLLASFTLAHCCYWTNLRMRAPLMPAVAVLAAAGASFAVNRKFR